MKKLLAQLTVALGILLAPGIAFAACNSNPTDSAVAASLITTTSGQVNGNVSSAGGGTCAVTARGFATSTSATMNSGVGTSSLGGTTGAYGATYTAAALSPNTNYYFRPYATNSNGTGFGAITNFMTLPNAPTALNFTSVAATSITTNWTAPSGGASTYQLERCITTTTTCTLTTGIAGVSQAVSSLTGNTSYDFAVRSVNANGGLGAFTATSTQLMYPGVPTAFSLSNATLTSLDATWTAPAGAATSYSIEYCITSTNTCTLLTNQTSVQTISGLTQSTSYDVAVQGVNGTGGGAFTATSTLSTASPTAPAVSTVAADTITVSSGNIKGNVSSDGGSTVTARGFATSTASNLATSVSTSTLSGTTGAFNQTYSNLALIGNTLYYFRAYAINAIGTTLGAITSFLTLPDTPGNPTYDTTTASSMNVNWTTPTGGASTYNLERCITSTTTCVLTTSIASSPQAVSGLANSTSYDFAVQAVNATGSGAWSATTTQTTLSPLNPIHTGWFIRDHGRVMLRTRYIIQ